MEEIKPELFGKYILLDKIATGGMAEIYLAKAPGAENVTKFVAIKRILPQYSLNQEFIEMFKEEAKIAIQLSHANIVPIFEFGVEEKLFFIAMEFVDGRNLRQILNRLKKQKEYLSVPQILFIIKEAAKGLDHAHRCMDGTTGSPLNITHRDISPQNIMLSYEGEVKIIDFGIAKAESKIETTRAGTLKGKFGYMSPEQAEGYEVDFRTDIFSLGIVLWELLANDRLFVSNSEINTLKKIRECHIPSLRKIHPDLPSELERITLKALARDRTLRYQAADELSQDLQLFLNKHYPEFTTRDLSNSLKSLFIDEREETRKKMIEFSKVSFHVDEKTEMISDKTRTVTETSSELTGTNSSNDKLSLDMNIDKKIDEYNLDFEKENLIDKSKNANKKRNLNNPNLKSFRDKTSTHIKKPIQHTQATYSYVDTSTILKKRKSGGGFRFLLYLCIIVGGVYHVHKNPNIINELLGKKTVETSQSISSVTPDEKKVQGQDPFFNLLVTSVPSGAEIFLDEKPTGIYTPGQIRVPVNKAYKIKLEKEGFLVETRSMLTMKQGEEVRLSLRRKETAFINVTVVGGAAAVYVNGKKISDRAPVLKHAVLANTTIKVQAYNPQKKLYAEKQIELSPNTVTQVQLTLSEARSPSNK